MAVIKIITVTASGGSIDLNSFPQVDEFVITGTATLTSNLTITSGASPDAGLTYKLIWDANLTLGANTVTVFGQTLRQANANKRNFITVQGDGSAFETVVSPDVTGSAFIDSVAIVDESVTTAKIDDLAVTDIKIAADAVLPSKASEAIRFDCRDIGGSFETNEQGNYRVYFPYKCRLRFMTTSVTKTLSGTDDGTVAVTTPAGTPTGNTIIIPASTASGTSSITTLGGAAADVLPDQYVTINFAKTTVGGKVLVTLVAERID